MNKEQDEELSKAFPLIDDRDFDYHAKIIKNFINKLLKEEKEEIQRDINSVIGMLNGSTDREEIKNYIVEYLKD